MSDATQSVNGRPYHDCQQFWYILAMLTQCSRLMLAVVLATSVAAWVKPQKHAVTNFGMAAEIPFSLRGEIYVLQEGVTRLPAFDGHGVGAVYTTALNIPKSGFMSGFPGVTSRFEWF